METRKKKEIRELYGGRIGWGCEAVGIACCAKRTRGILQKRQLFLYYALPAIMSCQSFRNDIRNLLHMTAKEFDFLSDMLDDYDCENTMCGKGDLCVL